MARYIFKQAEPTWLDCYYTVEAEDVEQAEERFYDGDCKFLGFDVSDSVEHMDNYIESVTEGDVPPFVAYPSENYKED